MSEFILVIAGVAISSIAMAIGIGGGILWTPLLILAYGLAPQEAITSSLIIQVVGLASGTYAYTRNGFVKFRISSVLFIAALPGIITGSFITIQLSQNIVQMSLGIMSMVLAVLFVSSSSETVKSVSNEIDIKQLGKIVPIPAFFGFIMGFLSLGIGEWLIPALRARLKMAMPEAIGTSIAMMFMLAIVASCLHIALEGSINYRIIIPGAIGTIIGAQIGAAISRKINDRLLKQSFIYLMTLIGIHLIFQAI